MTAEQVAIWMKKILDRDGCLYQEDVVDMLVREQQEGFLVENADGNLALNRTVLALFLSLTRETVVWVKPERYWRWRVTEDESSREARG